MHDDEQSTASAARSPELQALLRDLDELRLSFATDLSLAAAAIEAGSPELAGAVVESDRAELELFRQRALRHLAEAERPAVPAPARRRRRSLMTAVTPLLATAAAVLGVMAGLVPTSGADPAARAGTGTAMASYQEVTQLSRDGAAAEDVARAAERLHDELAAIVAAAASDPAAAQEALALLESEFRVLDGSADRDKLSGVLAEARSLLAQLRAALPAAASAGVAAVPAPTAAADDLVAPVEAVDAPALPAPRPQPSPEPEPSPSAAPAPSPSPSAPAPSTSPSEPSEPSESGESEQVERDSVLPPAVLPAD